jgi:deazaflavin-dependent oxidoreductase (nitroreductase family)
MPGETRRDLPASAAEDGASAGDAIGDEMVAWGHAARIRTRGRRSGLVRQVVVGFVEDDDGSVLVAAGNESAAWALNLLSDPACRVTIADRSFDAVAEPLEGADHAAAVRELILRGGTPAEALGHGPSFRLRPVDRL